MGADTIIDFTKQDTVETIMQETDNKGIEVGFEMAGVQASINSCLKTIQKTGRVIFLGLPVRPITLNWSDNIVLKNISIMTIYGRRIWETWDSTNKLLMSKAIDITPVITHSFKLEEFEKGIQAVINGEAAKVRFEMPN